jgi:ribosomal protein S18 acetylase RimI-like enzyme
MYFSGFGMGSSDGGRSIRIASDDDAIKVRQIDNAAFPEASLILQRAEPGELEAGIEAGDIYVLESAGSVVGYIYTDRSIAGCVYISGLAVHPAVQGRGLGGELISHVLAVVGDEPQRTPFVTVTSPLNTKMLRTIFHHGFAARWVLRDYFGPQRHRFACQLRADAEQALPAGTQWLPSTELDTVYWLMETQQCTVQSLVDTAQGPYFSVVPARSNEFLDLTSSVLPSGIYGMKST